MAAFARGSAYVNHDDEAGVLAVGMRADLAVVDRDPFDRSLGSIGETTTQLTIAAGRVVFDRTASSA
jgi:predicted amidohydrolase YtcJ